MTDEPIFFDTDCISSFLMVGKENLVIQLFGGRIVLPGQVYNEFKYIRPLKSRVDVLKTRRDLLVYQITLGSPESDLYLKLTTNPDPGFDYRTLFALQRVKETGIGKFSFRK